MNLPSGLDNTTSFHNVYDEHGNRTQIIPHRQEHITQRELENIPKDIFSDSVILIAPVVGEVETEAFLMLSKLGSLSSMFQGYSRGEESSTTRIKGFKDNVVHSAITILSEEDVLTGGDINQDLLDEIINGSRITVLTHGKKGATLYDGKNDSVSISPLWLSKEDIRDHTGAGDVFAASFILHYGKTKNLKEAGVFAAFFAALKIAGISGGSLGITTIPSIDQVRDFVSKNEERYKTFLKDNGVEQLDF